MSAKVKVPTTGAVTERTKALPLKVVVVVVCAWGTPAERMMKESRIESAAIDVFRFCGVSLLGTVLCIRIQDTVYRKSL